MFLFILVVKAQLRSNSGDFEIELSGDHYFQYHLPTSENNYNTLIKAPKWINELGLEVNHQNIELVSKWELRGAMDETGNWQDMSGIRIKENYLKINNDKVSWSFGFQDYAWGVADDLNPTNNLNPKDYEIKGFETEEISIFSAAFKYYPNDKWSFQGIFVPFEQSDVYFWKYEDFIPDEFFYENQFSGLNNENNQPQLEAISQVKNVKIRNLEFSPKSSLGAFKANYYSSGLDFSFSYIYDIDPYYTPDITLDRYAVKIDSDFKNWIFDNLSETKANSLMSQMDGNKSYKVSEINLERNRIHRFGFDAKTIIDRYGIWLEACYSLTEDNGNDSYKVRNHDLAYTLGFDFFYGPNQRFYFNLQYAGKWIPKFDDDFFTIYKNGIPDRNLMDNEPYMEEYYYRSLVQPFGIHTEGYTHSISTSMDFSFFNSTLKPTINAYYSIPVNYDKMEKKRYGSLLLLPELQYSPGHSLHLYLGANLAYSWFKPYGSDKVRSDDTTDLIGFLNSYNNIYFKISYAWKHKMKGP